MKILFYDMGSYTYKDVLIHLQDAGHQCKTIIYSFKDKYEDDFFYKRVVKELESEHYDLIFSINFFPLLSRIADEKRIRYLSWSYDSPLEERMLEYMKYETNYIFLFDREEVDKLGKKGCVNIFHMPLAVDTKRLARTICTFENNRSKLKYPFADVSFVGKIYESSLDGLLCGVGDYIKGYVDGILLSQLRIYGYNFLDELVTDDIVQQINMHYNQNGNTQIKLTQTGLVYAISSKITEIERTVLLEELSAICSVNLYATQKYSVESNINQMGPVRYYDEMPIIFNKSRINLNPTLKSIRSGIPLRAIDIMGSRGVLMSNYQPELAERFQDGIDLIMYGSIEEAIEKVKYYLINEGLLIKIAQNGYEKVSKDFTYEERINAMFRIAKLL